VDALETRFWSRVLKTETCWLWTGWRARRPSGEDSYGKLYVTRSSWVKAHRYSYRLHNGDFPEDLHVLHKCDNILCVNPEHLFLGTQLDNMRDMISKDRYPRDARRKHMLGRNGSRHSSSALSHDQIVDVCRRLLAGEFQQKIADTYGVSQSTISNIKRGVTYKDQRAALLGE
jgi:hypothetical protein